MLTDWRIRLRALFSRAAVERELDDELRFHFDRHVEQDMEAGLDRQEAVRRARLAFGGLDQVKEECRDARGIRVVDELWQDVSYALRMLRRRSMSSAAAILTLAIGIGLNAAVFSIVDWVLLRPLPYASPHELVKVVSSGSSPAGAGRLTYAEIEVLSTAASLRASAAFSTATRVIAGVGIEPAHAVVARVAGDLFGTLQVQPAVGRAFTGPEAASGEPLVVISDAIWRRWSASPWVVGSAVTIDGQPHTVAGVMPPDRGYPRDADLWRPLTVEERQDDDREYVMIGRLGGGIAAGRANPELATLAGAGSRGAVVAWAVDLQRSEVTGVRTALVALLASTAIILLIACANVAALLGARSTDRAGELRVRSALGASRARLVRQLLTETVLLTLIGGAAGLVLGRSALDLLVSLAPADVPRLSEVALDVRVVAIGISATFAAGLAVALVPARCVSAYTLPGGSPAMALTRASHRTTRRGALVAVQVALAIVLIVGAGLLARSLQHLVSIDHGFAPERLIAIQLTRLGSVTPDPGRLFRELIETSEAVPGVRSAAVAGRLPNQVTGLRVRVDVAGTPPGTPATVTLRPVTRGYFDTVGIPLLAGRRFGREDRPSAPRVAVVNTAFAREVLQGASPIGTRLTTDLVDGELTIVGEVANVTPAGEADRPALYVSGEQMPFGGGSLLVRTADAPRAVLPRLMTRLVAVAPNLALDRVHEIAELLAADRAATRFNMRVASAFAVLALLLAAVGVYGLTAGEVGSRWREMGVRLALGATRREVFLTVMRSSAVALATGIVFGLLIASVVAHGMRSLLYGVGAIDGVTLLSAPGLFAIIGLAASALAARRVLKADPATILRVE